MTREPEMTTDGHKTRKDTETRNNTEDPEVWGISCVSLRRSTPGTQRGAQLASGHS